MKYSKSLVTVNIVFPCTPGWILYYCCFKSQQTEYPSRHLVGAKLTIQLWVFVLWNWRTMVSPSTVLVVTGLVQLLKPISILEEETSLQNPWRNGVFSRSQDMSWWHTALWFWSQEILFHSSFDMFFFGAPSARDNFLLRSGAPTSWLC